MASGFPVFAPVGVPLRQIFRYKATEGRGGGERHSTCLRGKRPKELLRYAAVLRPHPQGRGELLHHRLLFKRQRTVCGKEVHGILIGKAGLAGALRQGHQHHAAFGTAGRPADLVCMDFY